MEKLSRNTVIRTNKILEQFENILTHSLESATKTRQKEEFNDILARRNSNLQAKVEMLTRSKQGLICIITSNRGEIEGLLRRREDLNSEVHPLISL
jgi:predicted RNase H-like nuclease (RuvC/YqgF family)